MLVGLRDFVGMLIKVEVFSTWRSCHGENLLPLHIRQTVAAWSHDIKDSTIFNCFMKSTVKVYEPTYWMEKGITRSGIPSRVQPSDIEQPEELVQGSSFDNDPEELREVECEVGVEMGYLQQAEVVQEMRVLASF